MDPIPTVRGDTPLNNLKVSDVKRGIDQIRESILFALTNATPEDLSKNRVELFNLALYYEKLGDVKKINCERGIGLDWGGIWWRFVPITKDLNKCGNLDKAFALAQTIENEQDKSSALLFVVMELIKKNQCDQAIIVAHSIPWEWKKNSCLKAIAVKLAENGEMTKALEIAYEISEGEFRWWTLGKISQEYVKQRNVNKALELANLLPQDHLEELQEIICVMIKHGDIAQALTLTNQIQNEDYKSCVLTSIPTWVVES